MREMKNTTKDVEWIVENDIATDKYCIYCGARIQQAVAYCTNCGQNQTTVAVQPLTQFYQQQQYYGQQPTYNQGYGQPQTYEQTYNPSRRAMKHKPKKDRSALNKIVAGLAVFSIIATGTYAAWYILEYDPFDWFEQRFAIVVGISDYEHYGEDDGDLRYADDDAEDWADYLEGQGYKVYKLIDHDATKNEIRKAIELVKEREGRKDHIVFTFSGHGSSDNGHSYLCPSDDTGYAENRIKDTELANWFEDFDSEHMFFFFDSCFSGGMDEVAGSGRYVTQTCAPSESGYGVDAYENGLWTYWFLEWGLNKEGYTDMETCFENAYPIAVLNAILGGVEMHPEQEDGDPDSSFKL